MGFTVSTKLCNSHENVLENNSSCVRYSYVASGTRMVSIEASFCRHDDETGSSWKRDFLRWEIFHKLLWRKDELSMSSWLDNPQTKAENLIDYVVRSISYTTTTVENIKAMKPNTYCSRTNSTNSSHHSSIPPERI